jgi:hypothetical protein
LGSGTAIDPSPSEPLQAGLNSVTFAKHLPTQHSTLQQLTLNRNLAISLMSTSTPASKAAQRLELNLKNLRRHDPAINAIVGQAAYVGAYWNDGTGWVRD